MSGTAPAKLRNGLARLYLFPNSVRHVSWAWVDANYYSYSSWTPSPGAGARVGTRPVPMPDGTSRTLVIAQRYPDRIVTIEQDTQHYGEPVTLDVPGLNLAEMTRLHRFYFLLGGHVHGPPRAYVLASATRESDQTEVERFNCVIHSMMLFTAGLTGLVLPPEFARRRSAALVNHWRGNAFPDIIQATDVFEVVKSFQDERQI
ncbi:MAG: hypothetical protein V4653_10350 [Pseudomonadota bacterium]